MQELLRFSYEGRELCLFKDKDKLKYGKRVGEEIVFKLSGEEKNIMDTIVVQIMPSSNLLDMGEIFLNEKSFQHFLDIQKGWHVFYEKKDSQLALPTEIDQSILNQMFNEQDGVVYENGNNKRASKSFIRRIVKVGGRWAVVLVSASLCFLLDKTLPEEKFEDEKYPVISLEEVEDFCKEMEQREDEDELVEIDSEEKREFRFVEIVDDKKEDLEDEKIFEDLVQNVYGRENKEDVFIEESNPYVELDVITKRNSIISEAIDNNLYLNDEEKEFLKNNLDVFNYLSDLSFEDLRIRVENLSFLYDDDNNFSNNLWDRYAWEDKYKIIIPGKCLEDVDTSFLCENIGIYLSSRTDDLNSNLSDAEKAKLLIDAIKNNSNLLAEEKEVFLSNEDVFYDTVKMGNFEMILWQLKNLRVVYNPDRYEKLEAAGTYDYITSTINIYYTDSFADARFDVLTHEFMHALSDFNECIMGNSIYEALNVKKNNEYYGNFLADYDRGYSWITNEVQVLGEILGPDIVQRYHVNPNPSILITALYKIIPSYADIIRFINNFDTINKIYLNVPREENPEKVLEAENKILENKALLKVFYEAKFGRSIDDDCYMTYLLDEEKGVKIIAQEYELDEEAQRFMLNYSRFLRHKKLFYQIDLENNAVYHLCNEVAVEKYYMSLDECQQYYGDDPNEYPPLVDGMYEVSGYAAAGYIDINLDEINVTKNLGR